MNKKFKNKSIQTFLNPESPAFAKALLKAFQEAVKEVLKANGGNK